MSNPLAMVEVYTKLKSDADEWQRTADAIVKRLAAPDVYYSLIQQDVIELAVTRARVAALRYAAATVKRALKADKP